MYIETSYVIYLAISLSVTVWVARTLHDNGRVFLVDAFRGNTALADSINRLLVVGFYMIHVGYVAESLASRRRVDTVRAAIELVSDKIGLILLALGAMHFLNLFLFDRLRRSQGYAGHEPAK